MEYATIFGVLKRNSVGFQEGNFVVSSLEAGIYWNKDIVAVNIVMCTRSSV